MMRPRAIRSTALRVLLILGVTAATSATGATGQTNAGQTAPPYVSWIERRASAAFAPPAPSAILQGGEYRIDAFVLLPLGFASPRIWSSRGAGTATFNHRDVPTGDGVLEAWELLAGSIPEKAHGYNRQGFFREAVLKTDAGSAWTAYFGAMTTWNEKSLAEAKEASAISPGTVDAIDGLTSPLEARTATYRVKRDQQEAEPARLWTMLQTALTNQKPRLQRVLTGSTAKPLPSLAFLGALEASLVSAARHRNHPQPAAATRMNFMHNDVVRVLELKSIDRATGQGRSFAGTNLVRRPEDVFELHYRILTPKQGDGSFSVFAELPQLADGEPDPLVIPLVATLRLRAYLELEFRRTQ